MENSNLNWGAIPTQRTRKKEAFTNPVMTMSSLLKKGAGRKFTFNKAAQAAMGLEGDDHIALAFSGKQIFVRKVESNTEGAYQLTKTCAFSNKRVYNSVNKFLGLSDQVENHFDVISVEGQSYFELVLQAQSTASATPETTVVEETSTNEVEFEETVAAIADPEPTAEGNDSAPADTEESAW